VFDSPPPSQNSAGSADAAASLLKQAAVDLPNSSGVLILERTASRPLSRAARIDSLIALERHISWLQAMQQRQLAALDAEAAAVDSLEKHWVREEVACALKISAPVARERLDLASRLCANFTATVDLLAIGSISLFFAKHLSDTVAVLGDDGLAGQVESAVLAKAPEQTFGEFSRALKRELIKADPVAATKRHVRAVAERDVRTVPLQDGVAGVWACLAADKAELAFAGIQLAASIGAERAVEGDDRTMAQRRADAFVELCVAPLNDQAGTTSVDGRAAHSSNKRTRRSADRQRRPVINVTVALSTLLRADDQPAELEGYGSIPASMARRIAADPNGTWRRLVTDPLGNLIDRGRTRYRPPADLVNHVVARDRVCVFPGCQRTARRCEIDHALDWDYGGCTDHDNLNALCPRHHHTKHDADWQLSRDDDANISTWTAPTGHKYRSQPPPLPISGPLSTNIYKGIGPGAPKPDNEEPPPF
jgi:hypothetical protein